MPRFRPVPEERSYSWRPRLDEPERIALEGARLLWVPERTYASTDPSRR